MSTGIPEATFQQLRAQYPLVIAPSTGGEACLARCGLNFTQVRFGDLGSCGMMRSSSGSSCRYLPGWAPGEWVWFAVEKVLSCPAHLSVATNAAASRAAHHCE